MNLIEIANLQFMHKKQKQIAGDSISAAFEN